MEHNIFVAPKIEHLPTIWATHKMLLIRGRKFFVFLRRHCFSLIRTRRRNRLAKCASDARVLELSAAHRAAMMSSHCRISGIEQSSTHDCNLYGISSPRDPSRKSL